jgi:hypothetical protein
MTERSPDVIADVFLYLTKEGGRENPLRGDLTKWYGCPCKMQKDDYNAYDCRIFIDGLIIQPGETHRLGMTFLSPEQALPLFHKSARFYLWEGRIIGEARIVESLQNS